MVLGFRATALSCGVFGVLVVVGGPGETGLMGGDGRGKAVGGLNKRRRRRCSVSPTVAGDA